MRGLGHLVRGGPRGFKVLGVLVLCMSHCLALSVGDLIVVIMISFWSMLQRKAVLPTTDHGSSIVVDGDVDADVDNIDLTEPTPVYTDKIDVEQFEDKLHGQPAFPLSKFPSSIVFNHRHRPAYSRRSSRPHNRPPSNVDCRNHVPQSTSLDPRMDRVLSHHGSRTVPSLRQQFRRSSSRSSATVHRRRNRPLLPLAAQRNPRAHRKVCHKVRRMAVSMVQGLS